MLFIVLDILLGLGFFYVVLGYPGLRRRRANAQLPARRRWALALCDIQLRRNGLPHQTETLRLDLPADRLASLRRSVLSELEIDGTDAEIRSAVQQALSQWAQGMGSNRAHFFAHMASLGQVRDAMALDCARTAFLVRCLALLDLCAEEAAWLVLLLNAQRAQDTFHGWPDFGRAYARARQAWLSFGNNTPATQRADLEVDEYLNDRHGNWGRLPWAGYRLFDPQPMPPTHPSASPGNP